MHRSSDVVFRCGGGGGYCVRMILFFTYTRFVCTINKRLKDYKFSSFAASYFFTWFLPHLFNHLPASLLRCFLSFFRSFSLIKQFLNLRFYSIFFGSKCCFVVVVGVAAALSHFSSHRWLLLSLYLLLLFLSLFSFFSSKQSYMAVQHAVWISRARYHKVGQMDFNSWCINIHSNHHRHMWVCVCAMER